MITPMRRMITIMRKTKLALRGQVISDRVGERPNATLTVTPPSLPPPPLTQRTMSVYILDFVLLSYTDQGPIRDI